MMIFGILAAIIGVYSLLIIIRIILSWFGNMNNGRFIEFLTIITDPYLNWWRRSFNLRIGVIDFSAVAGIAALSVLQSILNTISNYNRITLGIILAILLRSVWSILSFLLIFFLIVIILRLIAYLTNRNIYSPFWRIIESISQPFLYRINRIFFGKKINSFISGIIIAIALLLILIIAGNLLIPRLMLLFIGFPI